MLNLRSTRNESGHVTSIALKKLIDSAMVCQACIHSYNRIGGRMTKHVESLCIHHNIKAKEMGI